MSTVHRNIQPNRRHGFTLIEATLAIVVVSLVVVGALEAGGQNMRLQRSLADRQFASRLAESMLAEVAAKRYDTPSDTTGLLTTLASVLDRANLLGVSDYNGYTESPPVSRDGTPITTDATWSRSVAVVFVNPSSPTTTSLTDQGLKRITVTVSKSGTVLVTRSILRARDDS